MFVSVKEFQLKHWIFSFENNATLRKRWHVHTMKYYFLSNKTQTSNLGKWVSFSYSDKYVGQPNLLPYRNQKCNHRTNSVGVLVFFWECLFYPFLEVSQQKSSFFPFDNRMTCDFLSILGEYGTNIIFSSQTTQMLPLFAGCLRVLEIIRRLQD